MPQLTAGTGAVRWVALCQAAASESYQCDTKPGSQARFTSQATISQRVQACAHLWRLVAGFDMGVDRQGEHISGEPHQYSIPGRPYGRVTHTNSAS